MLLHSNPTAVTKVRGSMIIASWENRHLDWAALTSVALIREATASRKNRATALAYWLGKFYTPFSGKERPNSRQKDAVGLPTSEEDRVGRQREPAKEHALLVASTDRERDPAKGKWPEVVKPKKKKPVDLWEICTSGTSPELMPGEEPIRPKKRRLRRPASREEGTTTIVVDRFPSQGPPTRTVVRLVPREGQGRPSAMPPPPAEVVVTMAEDLPTMMAVEGADVPAEEEALPAAEALRAQEPTVNPTTALTDIQIPTWNLGEHLPIAPQV
jgi:hypothetical protein